MGRNARLVSLLSKMDEDIGLHDWAGKYAESYGTDSVLAVYLAPSNGIAFRLQGNSSVEAEGFGTVVPDGSSLKVFWKTTVPDSNYLVDEFIFTRYGAKNYLIPPREIHSFCIDLVAGRPNFWDHRCLTRSENGSNKSTPGRLELTGKYKEYLIVPEILATVIGVTEPVLHSSGKASWIRQSVTIDVGSLVSVVQGTQFISIEDKLSRIKVSKVFENSSIALIDQDFEPKNGFAPIRVGMHFRLKNNWSELSIFKTGKSPFSAETKSYAMVERNGRFYKKQ